MIYPKNPFLILACVFLFLTFSGCATVPDGPGMPTYSINGISYVPLASLCQAKGVALEYDSLIRSAILTKDSHRISLMAGERTILVDGEPKLLNHPVDIYEGVLVVPYRLEEILDGFSKEVYYQRKVSLPVSMIKKIVIDAGHGGNDPGATGRTGLKEKEINLDIARRLAEILREDGFSVVMTRPTDALVSLERRVELANQVKADLFISIHANANRVRSLNGFEVYYLAPRADDYKRVLVAANRGIPLLDNASFAGSRSANLRAILWDMLYTYNRAESIRLSRDICKAIDRDLNTRVIGVKDAGFYVLKGVSMPGILIEMGFLSNTEEERLLNNNYYRQQIAEAIVRGIEDYVKNYALAEVVN
jgi:N-acetylmuramoyl-L-alanine amidase